MLRHAVSWVVLSYFKLDTAGNWVVVSWCCRPTQERSFFFRLRFLLGLHVSCSNLDDVNTQHATYYTALVCCPATVLWLFCFCALSSSAVALLLLCMLVLLAALCCLRRVIVLSLHCYLAIVLHWISVVLPSCLRGGVAWCCSGRSWWASQISTTNWTKAATECSKSASSSTRASLTSRKIYHESRLTSSHRLFATDLSLST